MPHQRELLFLPPKSAPPTAVGSRGDSGFHRFSISSSSEGAGSTTEGRRRGGKGCRQAAPLPEREEVIVIRASTAAEWVQRFLSPAVLALAAGGGRAAAVAPPRPEEEERGAEARSPSRFRSAPSLPLRLLHEPHGVGSGSTDGLIGFCRCAAPPRLSFLVCTATRRFCAWLKEEPACGPALLRDS